MRHFFSWRRPQLLEDTVNLFETIEGKRGENLASAVLQYLLEHSTPMRDRFLHLLSTKTSIPICAEKRFVCTLEDATSDQSAGLKGRVDLCIETSNTVIGIENKFFAPFQEGQPLKYLPTLEERAMTLGLDAHHALAVVAPASREREVLEAFGKASHCVMLSWETVLKVLADAPEHPEADLRHVSAQFNTFVFDKLQFLPNFAAQVLALRSAFPDRGTPEQHEVVRRLWGVFPETGGRLTPERTCVGYYFGGDDLRGPRGWYGFIDGREIQEPGGRGSELIVVTAFEVVLDTVSPAPPFRKVRLVPNNFLGRGPKEELSAWIINFDEGWGKPEVWHKALQPLRDAIE